MSAQRRGAVMQLRMQSAALIRARNVMPVLLRSRFHAMLLRRARVILRSEKIDGQRQRRYYVTLLL